MRRTRKWAFVAQEATRLAELGLSPSEIARRLEVSRSTVTRWKAAGKFPKMGTTAAESTQPAVSTAKTPAEWAKAVREAYALDATDEQLVTVAETALALSLDVHVGPSARMTAAGRFQALVRQLGLVARGGEAHQAPASPGPVAAASPASRKNPTVRRPAGDPRAAILRAVK